MRRVGVTVGLIPLCLILGGFVLIPAVTAQQAGLTDAHLESAAIEVPQLVDLLELQPGMSVADVGAGFGAWTMGLSRSIGPAGRVYATDIGKAQLTALRETVRRESLSNVIVLEGAVGSTNLPALCCDAVLVRDAYHHFTQPGDMVRSLAAGHHRLPAATEHDGPVRRTCRSQRARRAAGGRAARGRQPPDACQNDPGLGAGQPAGFALPRAVSEKLAHAAPDRARSAFSSMARNRSTPGPTAPDRRSAGIHLPVCGFPRRLPRSPHGGGCRSGPCPGGP